MQLPEGGETPFYSVHWAIATSPFLFDDVGFDASRPLGGLKDLLPRNGAVTQEDAIALLGIWGPVLTVQGGNAPGIFIDPGNRVGAGLQTAAGVELQDDILLVLAASTSIGRRPSIAMNSVL